MDDCQNHAWFNCAYEEDIFIDINKKLRREILTVPLKPEAAIDKRSDSGVGLYL